jgi:ABC-type uncharacterized transport system permease subunit
MNPILATWLASFKEVRAKPRALVLDVSIMIVNDLTWVVLWVFLLDNTGTIRGWDIDRVLLLFAVVTVAFGLALGCCRNARLLSQIINSGEIDAALTLPVDTLSYLLVRRVSASNLGDVLFGLGVFFIACDPTPLKTLVFLTVCAFGAVVMTAFLVLLGSMTLHFGGKGEAQDLGFEAITIFGFYPIDMFGGPTKLMLFTALPAAFVIAVPVQLTDEFSMLWLAALVAAAVFFSVVARVSFSSGLRKYRSGSRWTTA